MQAKVKWALGLAAAPVVAYLALGRAPPPWEPFDGEGWVVESVMLIDPHGAATYALQPPCRVVRGDRTTLSRSERDATMPVMRMDFVIRGEHVTVFARLRE